MRPIEKYLYEISESLREKKNAEYLLEKLLISVASQSLHGHLPDQKTKSEIDELKVIIETENDNIKKYKQKAIQIIENME